MEKEQVADTCEMLIIGGSAGSLEVVMSLLPHLEQPMKIAIVVVLHRKSDGDSSLSKLFSYKTKIPVREVEDKEPIFPGTIYIAPADYHLLIEQERIFSLDLSEKIHFSRPSIDVAFESAAEVYGNRLVGLLLSGANSDGVQGLEKIRELGGLIVVQDPSTATVPVMPEHALARLTVDRVVDKESLPGFVNSL